jgi:predicted nucleic acid-binding protein
MSGIVFDTSVYVSALRQSDASIFAARRAARKGEKETEPLWLSSVVLEELYVGAQSNRMKKLLARLERDFDKVKRLLVPIHTDWTDCGRVLSLVGEKHGYEQVGRARMTNDTLIAMSVLRNGFTVLTKNADDFKKIAEFRPFNWEEI